MFHYFAFTTAPAHMYMAVKIESKFWKRVCVGGRAAGDGAF